MPNGSPNSAWLRPLMKTAGAVGLCLVSGVVGGALTRHFGTSSYTISYADFISVMLTAVSVLMTVLAIILAIAGVIGWTTIEQKVHAKAEDFLSKGFEKGGRLNKMVDEKATSAINVKIETMFSGVQQVDMPGNMDTEGGDEPK